MVLGRGGAAGGGRRAGGRFADSSPSVTDIVDPEQVKKPRSGVEILGYVLMGAGALLLYMFGEEDKGRGEGRR
ncbi:MAG: hypothetical protein R6U92_03265 [Bacillota bacterium]